MDGYGRLRNASRIHLVVAVAGGLLFEAAYLLGGTGTGRTAYSVSLYGFMLAVILTAVFFLLWGYQKTDSVFLLLSGIAVLSWFLGILFYTSYVFILGEVLVYPSVAQFAFHGFHLVIVPLLFYAMGRRGVDFWKPALLPVVGAFVFPFVAYVMTDTGVLVTAYNVFYLTVTVLAAVLAAHLVAQRTLPLFGGALLLFFAADIYFISTTFVKRDPAILFLHPIWFTASALISYSLIRYASEKESFLSGDLSESARENERHGEERRGDAESG